jgi:hypothetical protein
MSAGEAGFPARRLKLRAFNKFTKVGLGQTALLMLNAKKKKLLRV